MASSTTVSYLNTTTVAAYVSINDMYPVLTVPAPSTSNGWSPGIAAGGFDPTGKIQGALRPGHNKLLVELGGGQFYVYRFTLPPAATTIEVCIFATDSSTATAALIVLADGVPSNGGKLALIDGQGGV